MVKKERSSVLVYAFFGQPVMESPKLYPFRRQTLLINQSLPCLHCSRLNAKPIIDHDSFFNFSPNTRPLHKTLEKMI